LRSSGAAFALLSNGAVFALWSRSAGFALRTAFAWRAAFPSQSRLALRTLRTDRPRDWLELLVCVLVDRTAACH
jgi:hypothetical protein